jgi:Starch-binding associating with outer membrane
MNYMKRITILFSMLALIIIVMSCETGDISINPNAAGANSLVNLSLFVNRLDNEIYNGGGVMDGYSNNQPEGPWNQVQRWNQYFVSNYNYYWGNNFYNWTNTATHYGMLKYAVLLEQQANKQGAANPNKNAYLAVAKFYKAYSFVWMTQRVGDIPMTEAGNSNNLTPKFDKQHDVYKNVLAMLDTANTLLGNYNVSTGPVQVAGGIYGLTNLGWQKIINTYKLRVLISLSKREADNSDLNVRGQFAAILGDPIKFPILTSNTDNMSYKFNAAFNPYPLKANGNQPYSVYANVSNTYLNLTTSTLDPRTFLVATPAPAQIAGGKTVSNFTAYVGSDMNVGQATLLTNSTNGMYSFSTQPIATAHWQNLM